MVLSVRRFVKEFDLDIVNRAENDFCEFLLDSFSYIGRNKVSFKDSGGDVVEGYQDNFKYCMKGMNYSVRNAVCKDEVLKKGSFVVTVADYKNDDAATLAELIEEFFSDVDVLDGVCA